MKKLVMMILGGGMVLTLFANCGKNDNNPGGLTNMSAACYYQQTSSNGYAGGYSYMNTPGTPCNYNYSMLSASGFTQANTSSGGFYQTAGMYGLCNNGNQAPVYSPTKGVGCVDASRVMLSGQVVTYALNQQTMSFVPSSAPSPYYGMQGQQYGAGYGQYGYGGYAGGGYGVNNGVNGVLQVFRVCDSIEICPAGQFCRSPIGPGAPGTGVGICYF